MGQHLLKHPPAVQTANAAAPNWPGLQGALDPLLWVFFLTGAYVNSPQLRPRVAYAPATLPRSATEGVLHQQSAAALAQAEAMLSGSATGTAASDNAAGAAEVRRVLDAVFAALPDDVARGDVEHVSADDVAAAARTGRARGMAGVLALADAGVYTLGRGGDGGGAGLLRAADDVREAAGTLRAAAKHACMPLEVRNEAGARGLGDAVEAALDTALAKAGGDGGGVAAEGPAPGGDVEMADADKEASAAGAVSSEGAVARFRGNLEYADGLVREPSADPMDEGDGGAAAQDTAASAQQLQGLTRMAHMLLDSETCVPYRLLS